MMKLSSLPLIFLASILCFLAACSDTASPPPKIVEVNAENLTQAEARKQLEEFLPFEDSTDFVNARKGFIATREDPLIKNDDGTVSIDLKSWDFLDEAAPPTANPSLWRQGQLNKIHGLFEVTKDIYQVRGFDLANMTLIASDNGWTIIDPLTSKATSKAALALANKHLGEKPIKAVIFTHSHIDHFGGIRGIVSEEDISEGRVELIHLKAFLNIPSVRM